MAPAVFAVGEGGQRVNQRGIALGIGVVADVLDGVFRRQLGKYVGERPIDFGNARRVAAAEHIDGLVAFERVAEVVHQLQDAAVLREFFAECRELHVKLSVCKADWFVRYAV